MLIQDVFVAASFEAATSTAAWSKNRLREVRHSKVQCAVVVERESRLYRDFYEVEGFVIYRRHRNLVFVDRIVVNPASRGQGIGRFILIWLARVYRLARTVVIDVQERNVDAQLFLQHCGFRCETVLRGACVETDEDLYRFQKGTAAKADECCRGADRLLF